MKKLLFTFLLCLYAGVSSLASNSIRMGDAWFNVEFTERNKTTFMVLSLNSMSYSFTADPQILIRFFDDTTIELNGVCTEKDMTREGTPMNRYDVMHTTCEFPIKAEYIQKFNDSGVQKIRINTTPDIQEATYKKDKIGKKIYQQYQKSVF